MPPDESHSPVVVAAYVEVERSGEVLGIIPVLPEWGGKGTIGRGAQPRFF